MTNYLGTNKRRIDSEPHRGNHSATKRTQKGNKTWGKYLAEEVVRIER
jgi:hypothetical protein